MTMKTNLDELLNNKGFIVYPYQNRVLITKRFRRYAILLKPSLNISEDLVKSLFIIFGDGHYKSKLNLTNHEYRIHDFVLDTFEKELEVYRNVWRLKILHSKNENQTLMEIIKNYWLKRLRFEENQLYPNVSPSKKYKTGVFGIARIQIDKLIYADIIRALIDKIERLIWDNKLSEKNYYFIADAILNAEGSVLLDSQGIHRVSISFNENEKELFLRIFSKLVPEFVLNKKRDRITIDGWKNIYPFLKSFAKLEVIPFSLRPKDSFNLVSGFLNHKRTKALRNYLECIEKYPNKYFTQIAKLSNRNWKSAKVTLQIRNKDFIIIEKLKGRYLTNLSNEGKSLLRTIRTLEKWLPFIVKLVEEDNLWFKKLMEVIKNCG